MLKEATNCEKFTLLKNWMPEIVETVRKDLKNDHLRADIRFMKKHFAGKSRQKISKEEMIPAYLQEILEDKNEDLAKFIGDRWLLKNTDIYDFYAPFLANINPEFNEITTIEDSLAEKMIKAATENFGAINTYLFSIFNSVVFSEEIYNQLAKNAEEEQEELSKQKDNDTEEKDLEKAFKNQQREFMRMVDKYEKRLSGWEKKYHTDIAALKKQVSNLQRKLDSTC